MTANDRNAIDELLRKRAQQAADAADALLRQEEEQQEAPLPLQERVARALCYSLLIVIPAMFAIAYWVHY